MVDSLREAVTGGAASPHPRPTSPGGGAEVSFRYRAPALPASRPLRSALHLTNEAHSVARGHVRSGLACPIPDVKGRSTRRTRGEHTMEVLVRTSASASDAGPQTVINP